MTKKRKTKQLRWLVTMMMLAMTMVMPISTWAQQEMYTVYDNGTLTFKYGEKPGSGNVYDVPTDPTNTNISPAWLANTTSITTVVFDESFKNARPTSCYKWFYNCSKLTSIKNIENLNTEKVTNMMYMFDGCSGLTSLDVSSFNTAEVTDMSSMFSGCSGLFSLDLSSFNTAKVEVMDYMFGYCSNLMTIYVSDDFKIGDFTGGSDMFTDCNNLKGAAPYDSNNTGIEMAKLDGGYFTKSNLTPYVKWNWDTKVLTFKVANYTEGTNGEYKLNEGNTDPGWCINEVKNNCKKVVFTPSFNHAKPTSCYKWFDSFSNLTTIQGIENLNTEEVKNMRYMFEGCKKLTSLDLSSFNTAKVTNMEGMFGGCSGLGSLDLSSFNTAEVENMSYMFYICSSLTSLDLSSFNTAKVTDMANMFGGCSGLTSLDLSSFNTAKVEHMTNMFDICRELTSLDLSSFNTAKVTVMSEMFKNCSGLTTIYVSDDFKIGYDTNGDNMFYNCNNLKGDVSYNSDNTGIEMAKLDGYFTKSNLTPYVKWDASTKVLTFKVANTKEAGNGVYDLNEGAKNPGWSIDEVKNNCTKVVFTTSFNHAKPTSCYSWFRGFSKLTTIEGIENLNTEEVTNMSSMFRECSSLTSLDLSSFNTAEVTTMYQMFYSCLGLTSLDLSSFNTANVTTMGSMFHNCRELTSLTLSSFFNTANVTSMSYMINNCSKLESLNLSSFNTANVTNMSYMFHNCIELTSLDLSSFNTANVTDMSSMFNYCPKLTSLDLSSFNTANVTDMSSMFNYCPKLTSLDLSSFNTDKVKNMSYMFNGCSGLTSLDLSSFNTANVTNMNNMFYGCGGLTALDLSNFNTANVTKMDYMFYGCSGLTTIYVSDGFTTDHNPSGSGMFTSCDKLKGAVSYNSSKTGIEMAKLDGYFTESNLTPYVKWNGDTKVLTFKVANYIEGTEGEWKLNEGDTYPGWSGLEVTNYCTNVVFTPSFKQAKPTSCSQWFSGFWLLTTIEGIENLNTEEVTNMSGMFWGCSDLTSLDVSKFNTAKVENMSNMFNACSDLTSLDVSSFNTAKVTNMSCMFGNCTGLKSLDLSSFNTAKVMRMNYMFSGCSGLTTIYVSDDFKIGNGTDGYDMFSNCTSLVGAAPYDPNNTGIEMANYTSGYFKTYFTLGGSKVDLCGETLTTDILDLSGDKDFVAHAPFKANTATYSRDLSSSGSTWFSLCLPFAYTPDNFTAYQLKGATADAVEIEEITGTIAAGTPVLFKFKDGENKEINISVTDAQIVKAPVDGAKVNGPDGSSLQLCGTYQSKTFSSDDNNAFILLNDKLMNPAKMLENKNVTKVSVKPFRAYMTLTASAQTSSARAFSIGRGDEGNEGTSAIDLLNSVATDDAEYYDINGRRIDAPVKGVNIVRRGNKTMKLIIK